MLTLTFLGHAAFLAEGDGKRVIIDPFLTGNPKAPYPAERVPKLDAILLSHGTATTWAMRSPSPSGTGPPWFRRTSW